MFECFIDILCLNILDEVDIIRKDYESDQLEK